MGLLKSGTVCHLLWDSVFIDPRGDVYACCHSLPSSLGNLGNADLASIWTGAEARRQREQSLNGRLHCAEKCNILTPEEKTGLTAHPVYERHPKTVWILYGELCNIRCIMCPQDHRSKVMLDPELLQTRIDWTQVEDVEIQGGEILAQKGGMEFYVWLTREQGKKVNVITNGLLMSESWAASMIAGGNWIQVSLNASTRETHEIVNAGSRWEKALNGLRLLVDARRQAGGTGAEVIYKFTIVPQNAHEMADAVERAVETGCSGIAYGFDREVPAFLAGRPDLVRHLRSRFAELLSRNLPLSIERKRLTHLGLLGDPLRPPAAASRLIARILPAAWR